MKKNIIDIHYSWVIIIFALFYLSFYLGIYQKDYYIYCCSKSSWFVTEAQIVDVYSYKDGYRLPEPVTIFQIATVEYDINGINYQDKVFMSFCEKQGDIINVAVKKADYSNARRCEFVELDRGTMVYNKALAVVSTLIIAISLIQRELETKRLTK